MVGELDGYGTVWYNPKGIANILLLSQVEKKHRVTYDSAASNAFVVHKNDSSKRRFAQAKSGLFYLDMKQSSGTVVVNTIEANKSRRRLGREPEFLAVSARGRLSVVG